MFSNFQILDMTSPERWNWAWADLNIKLKWHVAATIIDTLPPQPQAAQILLEKKNKNAQCL